MFFRLINGNNYSQTHGTSTYLNQCDNTETGVTHNGLLFVFVFYLLVTDFINKIVLAVTTELQRIRTEAPVRADLTEIKLEPDNVHDSLSNVSQQIENNCDRAKFTQNVDRSGELRTGKFF